MEVNVEELLADVYDIGEDDRQESAPSSLENSPVSPHNRVRKVSHQDSPSHSSFDVDELLREVGASNSPVDPSSSSPRVGNAELMKRRLALLADIIERSRKECSTVSHSLDKGFTFLEHTRAAYLQNRSKSELMQDFLNSFIERCERYITDVEGQRKRLEHECQILREKLELAKEIRKDAHSAEIVEVEEKYSKEMEELAKEHELALTQRDEKLEEAEKIMDEYRKQLMQLKDDMKSTEKKVREQILIEQALEEHDRSVQSMRDFVGAKPPSDAGNSDVVDTLQATNASLASENDALKETASELRSELSALREELRNVRSKQLINQSTDDGASPDNFPSASVLEDVIRSLERDMEAQAKHHKEEINKIREKEAGLLEQLNEQETINDALRRSISSLEEQLTSRRSDPSMESPSKVQKRLSSSAFSDGNVSTPMSVASMDGAGYGALISNFIAELRGGEDSGGLQSPSEESASPKPARESPLRASIDNALKEENMELRELLKQYGNMVQTLVRMHGYIGNDMAPIRWPTTGDGADETTTKSVSSAFPMFSDSVQRAVFRATMAAYAENDQPTH